jgi:Uma2 family endonuclease
METATLWHRVLHDPQLQDLPFKIETNEHGQLVLSPHKPQRGYLQMRIGELLRDHVDRPGRRAVEFAVETAKGIKVPDVAWISEERWAQIPDDAEASPVMPELCVEVLSESNTEAVRRRRRAGDVDLRRRRHPPRLRRGGPALRIGADPHSP